MRKREQKKEKEKEQECTCHDPAVLEIASRFLCENPK